MEHKQMHISFIHITDKPNPIHSIHFSLPEESVRHLRSVRSFEPSFSSPRSETQELDQAGEAGSNQQLHVQNQAAQLCQHPIHLYCRQMCLRELDLEHNAGGQLDQDVDQSTQDHVDLSKDLEVEGQPEFDHPLAACSREFLPGALF
jgi:hypothetical protein